MAKRTKTIDKLIDETFDYMQSAIARKDAKIAGYHASHLSHYGALKLDSMIGLSLEKGANDND